MMGVRRLAGVSVAALLCVPSAAFATKVHYIGTVQNVPGATFSFDAFGKQRKKPFLPRSVGNFRVTDMSYTCTGPRGSTTTTTTSDLPFGFIESPRVSKKGKFSGQFDPPSANDRHAAVAGSISRKKVASGTLHAFEGQPAQVGFCSTPETTWSAKPVPLVCSVSLTPVPLCAGAPRP
jgi:hypothetical protein